jgi:DoxX-like family
MAFLRWRRSPARASDVNRPTVARPLRACDNLAAVGPTIQNGGKMIEGNRKAIWAGRVISILVALPFAFSAAMKLVAHPEVIKGMAHLGLPESLIVPLGIIELLCVVVYLVPQTSFLGAILLTGFVGGTIITHLRVGEPVYLNVIIGFLIWVGLYLRRPRLREVVWSS